MVVLVFGCDWLLVVALFWCLMGELVWFRFALLWVSGAVRFVRVFL